MAKEPPILVVNKTDRPTAASRRKRTASAGSAPRKSRKPSGKKKRKGERRLPGWLLWILGGLSAIVFLSAFYYFFIRSVELEPGDLPPVLDIETRSDDMDKLRKDLLIWLHRIEAFYRVKPILYTSYKYKTRFLNDSIFNTYPYWIAHYYVDSVEYQGPWKFWQHTDVGTLPGIQERVDLNVFNGTLEELQQMTIPAKDEE